MSNSLNSTNQQIPSYSGITINISNPTMNTGNNSSCQTCGYSQNKPTVTYSNAAQYGMTSPMSLQETNKNEELNKINNIDDKTETKTNKATNNSPVNSQQDNLPQAYPPQYYLNNYNYIQNGEKNQKNNTKPADNTTQPAGIKTEQSNLAADKNMTDTTTENEAEDLSLSEGIISDLDAQVAQQKDLEKNGKQSKVVALTNEYIMSLENYLNNPNKDLRIMASKEILTRLDEDKTRHDDAALNALLNKMLQDPEPVVRSAALSAFSSRLASGNDFTIELLNKIQSNPNSNETDVLEAANILLNMSSNTEIKYTAEPKNFITEQQVKQ